jgi:hypothetical protein
LEYVLNMAKRELLPMKGVVGISVMGNTIVVYVEDRDAANKIPSTYRGYPVVVYVVGKIAKSR